MLALRDTIRRIMEEISALEKNIQNQKKRAKPSGAIIEGLEFAREQRQLELEIVMDELRSKMQERGDNRHGDGTM